VTGDVKAVDFASNFAFETEEEQYKAHMGLAVFSIVSKEFGILPLVLSINKDEAGADLLIKNKKGDDAIDQAGLLPILIGAFGAFLTRNRGYGQVRIDHLRNSAEEAAFRTRWDTAVLGCKRIDKALDFEDSAAFPEIQAADVLLGLLRGQHEHGWTLPKGITDFLRRGEAAGSFVIHLS